MLFGVLPVFLLFVLNTVTGWAFMSELAVYLARSALDRKLSAISETVSTFRNIPPEHRRMAIPEVEQAYRAAFPGMLFYLKHGGTEEHFPADAPVLAVSDGWKNVSGLLLHQGRFYGWAHYRDDIEEITVLAPLTDGTVANLVPHLGVIGLVGVPAARGADAVTVGGFNVQRTSSTAQNAQVSAEDRMGNQIPPAMGQLDFPVLFASEHTAYRLEQPGKSEHCLLWVHSRPSAVLRVFFSDAELFRGILFDIVIGVAVLFLLVELGAVLLGISLTRRITGAVNALYAGTKQVTSGDFSHRIPVTTNDQLGELGRSFNQMTENLERLLASEKERERLQAELEIAREVQDQLYPREEPPACGLKLTASCEPARMVSGDYYDYQLVGKAQLAFAIGDVAGKGISAALLMATIQAALRAQVSQSQPLREDDCSPLPEIDSAALVSKLNKQVYAHTSPEKYATFFFALFDEKTKTLTYTNAGHLCPLLFRNGSVTPLDTNGTVVGAFPWAKYEASCIKIEAGDLLVCYTDGISEPENAYGEMFGEERMIELIHKHADAPNGDLIQIVFDAVRSWTGSPELFDDMTLLLARQVGSN